jgi:hypothetical protein
MILGLPLDALCVRVWEGLHFTDSSHLIKQIDMASFMELVTYLHDKDLVHSFVCSRSCLRIKVSCILLKVTFQACNWLSPAAIFLFLFLRFSGILF